MHVLLQCLESQLQYWCMQLKQQELLRLLWCVQVANAIFRMGGAAIMCSNKPCFWRTAK